MDDTQLSEIVEVILRNPKNLATKIELNEQAKVALKLFVENDSDYNNFLGFEELKKICVEISSPFLLYSNTTIDVSLLFF